MRVWPWLAPPGHAIAMHEIDLLVQRHFLQHQVRALIRRKARVHPRTVLFLLVLLPVRVEPPKFRHNDHANREHCCNHKSPATRPVHFLQPSCEIKFASVIIILRPSSYLFLAPPASASMTNPKPSELQPRAALGQSACFADRHAPLVVIVILSEA